MNLRHLNIFMAVAQTGSMSEAAKQLFISQPSVSQAIRELEEYYGLLLFERIGRKLYITEAGRSLMTLSNQVLSSYQTLDLSMTERRIKPILRVGSSTTVGTSLMPDVISELETAMPALSVFSVVSNTRVVEEKLLRAELDIGVVEGHLTSHDLIATPVAIDQLVLICGSQHPLYQKDVITPRDLNGQRFACREEGSGTRKHLEDFCQMHEVDINIYCEANCPRTLMSVVMKNNALSVLSPRLIHHHLEKGRMKAFRLSNNEWDHTFKLVYHRAKRPTKEMERLKEILIRHKDYTPPDYATGILQV